MARQAGLGKSLHEVLESLQPAESWPEGPRIAREQLERELDELLDDVQALRERVQELTAATSLRTTAATKKKAKKHKKHGKKSTSKAKAKAAKSKHREEQAAPADGHDPATRDTLGG